jgi:hypothetical protein
MFNYHTGEESELFNKTPKEISDDFTKAALAYMIADSGYIECSRLLNIPRVKCEILDLHEVVTNKGRNCGTCIENNHPDDMCSPCHEEFRKREQACHYMMERNEKLSRLRRIFEDIAQSNQVTSP